MTEAYVGRTAFALGFAGLLPQLAAVGAMLVLGLDQRELTASIVGWAALYAAIILSFLGGMWWSIAMHRTEGQGLLATLAVLPSLVGFASLAIYDESGWAMVATGSAILLTLLVDRHLTATGEAPANWMRLRVPLSVGLGGLTILAGALVGVA